MHKKFKIITFLSIFAVFIGLMTFFLINSSSFKQNTASFIANKAEEILKTKINIDSLEIVSLNSAVIDDVEIYDKENELLAKADKVVFKVNLWEVVTQSPLSGLSEIHIDTPDVNIIQREDKTWNFEDLIDKESTEPIDFKGDVKIINGQSTIKIEGKQITIDKIDLGANCEDLSAIKVNGSLQHNNAPVDFSGTIGEVSKTNVDVHAENLDVLNYIPFIPEEYLADINIKKGIVKKANVTISGTPEETYNLDGSINFVDGQCEILGQNIEDIDGIILLNKQDVQVFVRAMSKEQKVMVHGNILNYMSDPDLHLIVETKSFRPELFFEGIPFSGEVSLVGAVYGTLDNLQIGAQVNADEANVYGYPVEKLNIQARYINNQIFIDDLRGNFANGWIWASGTCNLDDLTYKGSFRAANIDVTVFSDYLSGITGTAMLRGDFKGQGVDFADLDVSGRAQLDNGSYDNIPIDKIELSFYKEQDTVQIDAMTAEFASGGNIAAKGLWNIENDDVNIDFYASNVDMSLAQNYIPSMDIQGNANFSGSLVGNIENPVLNIDLMAKDGSIMNQPFDSLLINAIGNLDGMRVDRCQFIQNGEIVHDATGLLGFKGKRFIDMIVKTNKARMENLIKVVMPDLKITGNVDNTLHLTGNLENIKAQGKLHFYEGSLNGILISEVDGTYDYNDGNICLNNFDIISPFIKANLNGTIDRNQEMNIKFNADEILINKMPLDLPYPVEGKANFDGTLTGHLGALNFDGILKSDTISLNGQNVNDIYGHLTLANRILKLEQFKFIQNAGMFDFNGDINLNTKEIQGKADLVQLDINALMAMANLKNEILNGRFNGTAELNGTYVNPHVDLKGSMLDGTLKDYPLQNIEIDAQLDNSIVKINKFYGEQGLGKVAVQGSADLANGPIDARISASNMDIKLLTHLCDLDIDLNGQMNTDIQLSGTIDNPIADISIFTQGDGSKFDDMYLLANLKDNIININQMAITKGECSLKANGTVPLAALESQKRTEETLNQQMNLKLYLENTNLDILPTLTPYVEWAVGNVQGDLNITGTVQKPNFQGNITTKDSAIKFKHVDSPIQNINVDINFNRDLMTIQEFTGKIGEGNYNLVGSAHITGQGITGYNFNLDLNDLEIVSDYYTGLLVGNLQVNEVDFYGKKLPKLTTNLNFNDIEVAMPPLPEISDEPFPEMVLDINVALGDNVHAYDPLLYDLYIEGAFNIKGTTLYPKASGSLHVNKGTIDVLKNIFKVQTGNIVFNQVGSFFPSIDFLAMTRLDRTKIFVSLQGPLDKDLEPKLYSEPYMNDAEIIKLLAFRTDGKDNNSGDITEDDLLSLATVGLQMSFLNEIEGTLRNVLNLDEFKISRDTLSDSAKKRFDTDDGEVYNIEIGKYLSDKVMLKYTRGINYDLNRIGLQYYINNNMGIITELEDDGVYNIKLEMEWKF